MTTIHDAASNGRTDEIQKHLNNGVPVDDRNEYGSTPASYAGQNGHIDALKLLIANGANVNEHDKNRRSLLNKTISGSSGNQEDATHLLLEAGANANLSLPIHDAARAGNVPIIRDLIAHGAQVDNSDEIGSTALQWAAAWKHPEAITALLDAGADIHHQNEDGDTALSKAVKHQSNDAAHVLLEHGANPNQTTNDLGTTLVHHAAGLDDPTILKDLLAHGGDPHAQTQKGFTPLSSAASKNKPDSINVLLDAGSDVNHQDKDGVTPLMMAVNDGAPEAVKALLDRGADMSLVNRKGHTAQDFITNHEGARRSEVEKAFLDHAAKREPEVEQERQAPRRRM
jgi:ankyrin